MPELTRLIATACIVLLLAACAKNTSEVATASAPAYGGTTLDSLVAHDLDSAANADGDFLAYEHEVSVTLPSAQIPARLQEARRACLDSRFGECVVLNVEQVGGDFAGATLGLRIVPAGVEPMIALASDGAELGSRSTRAEDLAVAVRDTDLARARLRKERDQLQAFQSRPDLAVADMIALSKQLSETEAELEMAEQQGAQHRRRIQTQLLTLAFDPTPSQTSRNAVWRALRESGETLSAGVAWTIRAVAFLLPPLLLLLLLVAGIRRWRRRGRA